LSLLAIAVAATYVAGELAATNWMTTYLVKTRGMRIDAASDYLTGFFLIMMLARLACTLVATPARERFLLIASLVAPAALLVVGLVGPPSTLWALSLAALVGPFYPVFLARFSRRFPDTWRTLWIWAVAAMNVTIGTMNFALGWVAETVSIQAGFAMAPLILLAASVLLLWYLRLERLADGATNGAGATPGIS
jgi:fucose permease